MATAKPIIHIFKEINVGKYSTVRHYELIQTNNGQSKLGTLINLSKDRNFAKSLPDYWLKLHNGKKWNKPITGLFKTQIKGFYKGDCQRKRHLILANFEQHSELIKIYFYPNYFTIDVRPLIEPLIQSGKC